jgi:hypothetical protein
MPTPEQPSAAHASKPMRRRSPSALARSTPAELRAFEQLLATLSAGFIGLGAEHIDGAIEDALQRIARTLKLDRCSLTTISPYSGRIEVSHSQAAPGLSACRCWTSASNPGHWPGAGRPAGGLLPARRLAGTGRRGQDTLWIGLKSHVTMLMVVAGQLRGGLSFGAAL